ncbi:MAG: hypothetical protein HYW34_00690 [Candidatus Brennerbacteria bacterium]|nr:hypothetical protein [Candidatus Brennerbacteria bacterium]
MKKKQEINKYKSKCCKAEVKIEGIPDFEGGQEVCTMSFVCVKCGKDCDAYLPEFKNKNRKKFLKRRHRR